MDNQSTYIIINVSGLRVKEHVERLLKGCNQKIVYEITSSIVAGVLKGYFSKKINDNNLWAPYVFDFVLVTFFWPFCRQ